MLYFILLTSLLINVTQGAPQDATKHPPTTAPAKTTAKTAAKMSTILPQPSNKVTKAGTSSRKGTGKPSQPLATGSAQNGTNASATTVPVKITEPGMFSDQGTAESVTTEATTVNRKKVEVTVEVDQKETKECGCGYVNAGVGTNCPPQYEMVNSHCYHFSQKQVSWDVAKDQCELLGGRLAVIEDPKSFEESITHMNGNESFYWVGAKNSDGFWEWINGHPLQDNWGLIRPMNSSRENSCLMLNQQMGAYVVNQKETAINYFSMLLPYSMNQEAEHEQPEKIAVGGFTIERCNKTANFICDTSPTGCDGCCKKNISPELSGLSSIESLIVSNTRRAPKYPAKCPKNFQNVFGMCVYFSEVKKCWEDAATFCRNLRIGTAREVTLAVLTDDVRQNHMLLQEVARRGSNVWLGGFRDQLSMYHLWVDGNPVDLGEYHWNETEPDHSGNCISAEVKWMLETRRTYLYDEDCTSLKHFVCRATCPDGFEEYGDSCYSFSTEPVTWKTAERRCRDLSIGLDQNVHLATFGVDTEDDMNLLAEIAFQVKGSNFCFHGYLIGNQCMHIECEKMDWESARKTCEASGMVLAEPRDPQALAEFMHNKSMQGEYHLGGHYMDGNMVWVNQDSSVFPDYSSVWVRGFSGKNLSVDSTLAMTLGQNGPLYIQVQGTHAKFICEEKNNYWIGGSRTYFKDWVWTNGGQVDLNSPYFAKREPRLKPNLNCLIAKQSDSSSNKAFLKSDSCECLNRYICQASDINPFGKEFIQHGDGYYYISSMNNHTVTTWQGAREICQGLKVPEMYTVDLAVLNRQDQRDSAFEIDFLSMNKGFSLWIGAHAVTINGITNWVWVNTQHQEVLPESIYWSLDLDTTPIEGANVYLTWEKWETSYDEVKEAIATHKESVIAKKFQGFRKPVLYWEQNSTTLRDFVCQVFDKA